MYLSTSKSQPHTNTHCMVCIASVFFLTDFMLHLMEPRVNFRLVMSTRPPHNGLMSTSRGDGSLTPTHAHTHTGRHAANDTCAHTHGQVVSFPCHVTSQLICWKTKHAVQLGCWMAAVRSDAANLLFPPCANVSFVEQKNKHQRKQHIQTRPFVHRMKWFMSGVCV